LKILVIGVLRYESGKTSFALELLNSFKEVGIDIYPYKPIGGHSGWYQYTTIINSIKLGKLVGEDAYHYAEAINCIECIEQISPLDFLLIPYDIKFYQDRIRSYIDLIDDVFRQIILVRLTTIADNGFRTVHYLVKDNYKYILESMENILRDLVKSIKYTIEIGVKELTSLILNPELYYMLDNILAYHESRHELVLIESFNDVALPIPSAINSSYVIVVAPGRVLLYDGNNFRRAVEIVSDVFRPLALSTSSILRIMKQPLLSLPIPPKQLIYTGVSKTANDIVSYIINHIK